MHACASPVTFRIRPVLSQPLGKVRTVRVQPPRLHPHTGSAELRCDHSASTPKVYLGTGLSCHNAQLCLREFASRICSLNIKKATSLTRSRSRPRARTRVRSLCPKQDAGRSDLSTSRHANNAADTPRHVSKSRSPMETNKTMPVPYFTSEPRTEAPFAVNWARAWSRTLLADANGG